MNKAQNIKGLNAGIKARNTLNKVVNTAVAKGDDVTSVFAGFLKGFIKGEAPAPKAPKTKVAPKAKKATKAKAQTKAE